MTHTESIPSVPELIEAMAERSPLATAVVSTDGSMTYDELRRTSGRIAAALAARGIGRGDVVAVCLERTGVLVPALLGVLRAGAAYLPVDPSFPPARIGAMLQDARPRAVLTDRAGAPVLKGVEAEQILVHEIPESARPPACGAGPDDLAYVMYTSGSTGAPKGVMIEHGSLTNVLRSAAELIGAGPTDRFLAVTTVSFDIAALELFVPLLTGGTVVLAQRRESLDGRILARLLDQHAITIMQATPATWRMLVAGGWAGRPGMRALVGGETLPPALAGDLVRRVGSLWNMYGPTETTIWSTAHRVAEGDAPVPIGRALANTSLLVVDEQLQPAEEGELLIGGAGVARGYLGRAELTAERFIPDPTGAPGRVYRTGDVVRWGAGGVLEFIGRRDHQVKIRGYRVELAEVEAALATHPAIEEVIAGTKAMGEEKSLVAFVSLKPGTTLTLGELRHWGGNHLPHYMLPTCLLIVDAMPRTTNGKTDRAALAAQLSPSKSRPVSVPEAKDDLDLVVLTVFRELLGTDHLTADDDFFDMGGHSLMAFRAAQEIERRTGRSVDVGFLFEHSTVKSLAQVLRERGGMAVPSTVIDLQPQGDLPPLICVCGVALYLPLARALAPNQPVVAVYVDVDLNVFHSGGSPDHSLTVEAIAERYAEVIRAQHPRGPYRLLGFSIGGAVAYEVARRLVAAGEKVELVAMIDSYLADSVKRRPLHFAFHAAQRVLAKGPRWALRRAARALGFDRPKAAHPTLSSHEDAAQRREIEARGDAIVATYKASPLDVNVLLFNAADRPRLWWESYDETGGWTRMVGEHRFRMVMLPGDHTDLLPTPTGSASIAREIRNSLRHLDAPVPSHHVAAVAR